MWTYHANEAGPAVGAEVRLRFFVQVDFFELVPKKGSTALTWSPANEIQISLAERSHDEHVHASNRSS